MSKKAFYGCRDDFNLCQGIITGARDQFLFGRDTLLGARVLFLGESVSECG